MAPIELTAIITPKPGKAARFLELWESCVRYVRENEPYVHRYELHNGTAEQNGGKQQFVILEGYNDKEAMDKHLRSPPVVEMVKALEAEQLTDTQIIMTTKGSGISARL